MPRITDEELTALTAHGLFQEWEQIHGCDEAMDRLLNTDFKADVWVLFDR